MEYHTQNPSVTQTMLMMNIAFIDLFIDFCLFCTSK